MVLITINDTKVNATQAQADAIEKLMKAHGFAAIHEYQPSTNWKVQPVQTIYNCNVGIKISRLYKAQIEALKAVKFEDLDLSDWIADKGRDACGNAKDQFDLCIGKLIESKAKLFRTQVDIEAEDAHRKGHFHNYITIHNSIKVNLVNEKNDEGVKRPVLADNGHPTVETILIPYTSATTKTLQEGVKKAPANSGSKVRMDKAIEKTLDDKLKLKMVSLKEGNFKKVAVMGQEITEAELYAEETEAPKVLKA